VPPLLVRRPAKFTAARYAEGAAGETLLKFSYATLGSNMRAIGGSGGLQRGCDARVKETRVEYIIYGSI